MNPHFFTAPECLVVLPVMGTNTITFKKNYFSLNIRIA